LISFGLSESKSSASKSASKSSASSSATRAATSSSSTSKATPSSGRRAQSTPNSSPPRSSRRLFAAAAESHGNTDGQENNDGKDSKDSKDSKFSKENKDGKDSKETKRSHVDEFDMDGADADMSAGEIDQGGFFASTCADLFFLLRFFLVSATLSIDIAHVLAGEDEEAVLGNDAFGLGGLAGSSDNVKGKGGDKQQPKGDTGLPI